MMKFEKNFLLKPVVKSSKDCPNCIEGFQDFFKFMDDNEIDEEGLYKHLDFYLRCKKVYYDVSFTY